MWVESCQIVAGLLSVIAGGVGDQVLDVGGGGGGGGGGAVGEAVGSAVAEGLRGLPWSVHGLSLLVLATGVALWLWGGRLLKPLTITVFVVLGMVVGFFAVPAQASPADVAADGTGLMIGTGLGALFGLIAGLVVYRSALAVAMGVVLMAAGPIVASSVMYEVDRRGSDRDNTGHVLPDEYDNKTYYNGYHRRNEIGMGRPSGAMWSEPPLSGDALLLNGVGVQGDDFAIAMADVDAIKRRISEMNAMLERRVIEASESTAAVRVRAFARHMADEIGYWWDDLPAGDRFIYAVSALGGLAIGVLIGLALPMKSAGVVTAMVGAAITLVAGAGLSTTTAAPWASRFAEFTPRMWLVLWIAATIFGVIFQLGQQGKSGSRSSSGGSPAKA